MQPTPTEHGNLILDPRTLAITVFEPKPTGPYEERIYSEALACAKKIQEKYMWAKDLPFEEFYKVFRKDGGFEEFVLNAKDNITSYKNDELRKFKKACINMGKMTSNIIEDVNNIIVVPVWSYIHYNKGRVICRFNDAMAYHLLHMEHGWTKRQLDITRRLERPRAQTLYRVLHTLQFEAKKQHGVVFLSKKQLIEILYPTQYQIKNWGQFTYTVLEPTLEHIRQHTEFKKIDYTYVRQGVGGEVRGAEFNFHFDSKLYETNEETGEVKKKYKYSRDVLQKEANDCWDFHRLNRKPCRVRNCHKCQFCYELGRYAAHEPKPFGWVFNGTGGIVERGKSAALQQSLFATEEQAKSAQEQPFNPNQKPKEFRSIGDLVHGITTENSEE